MGKIRIKTIGDESLEKEQQEEARKRKEMKKSQTQKTAVSDAAVESVPQISEEKESTQKTTTKKPVLKDSLKHQKHSNVYQTKAALIDKNKVYALSEALSILPKVNLAKFDETVELHINTTDKGIAGSVVLPHGTGKQIKVAIANGSDTKSIDDLVKRIEEGKIDFDVLIATPDAMPRLAHVAKILGPRGLMPNPKNGTVTPKPDEAAAKFAGGQLNYKTEAKFPILHVTVGKLSFGEKKLTENIKTYIQTIQVKNIKNTTLKSTMSPGIKIDFSLLT